MALNIHDPEKVMLPLYQYMFSKPWDQDLQKKNGVSWSWWNIFPYENWKKAILPVYGTPADSNTDWSLPSSPIPPWTVVKKFKQKRIQKEAQHYKATILKET